MYFGLSEEQSFFQNNVRKYLAEHVTIDNIKHIASGDEKNLSAEIHQGLLNLGINGLLIPKSLVARSRFTLCSCRVRSFRATIGPYSIYCTYVMAPIAIRHAGSISQTRIIFLKSPPMNVVWSRFGEFIGQKK